MKKLKLLAVCALAISAIAGSFTAYSQNDECCYVVQKADGSYVIVCPGNEMLCLSPD